MIGYHFTDATLRDGRPIPTIGEWLVHDGPVIPCESGLHASEHPFDALQYAPGPRLHRVELEGDLVSHGEPTDKWCGRRRRIIATIDATPIMREFARWCAWQVIHLWDAPEVVVAYLKTGDESLREAAWEASWAAGTASWAALEAAGSASWAAGAAREAARKASGAAWLAAGEAAGKAAGEASGLASWAAREAARKAAGEARKASEAAQRSKFMELLEHAFSEAARNSS